MLPPNIELELLDIYNSERPMCTKLIEATKVIQKALASGLLRPRRRLCDYLIDIGWDNFKEASVKIDPDISDQYRMTEAEIIEECLEQIYDGIGRLEDLLEIERQTSVYHIPYRRYMHE